MNSQKGYSSTLCLTSALDVGGRDGNLKCNLTGIIWDFVDWIYLAQDRDTWWAVVNAIMNPRVPYNAADFLTL
jgi:hypothetical protein